MAKIEFVSSDRTPVELSDRMIVGRSADMADIVVDDKRLSRKHCEIVKRGDAYQVRDLASRNGTTVNGESAADPVTLKNGDEISLGGMKLTFRDAGEAGLELEDSDADLDLDQNELDLDATDGALELDLGAPEAAPASKPGLKVLKGTLKTVLIPIPSFPFSIGRKPSNDLSLDGDAQASGTHARIEKNDDGTFTITDLNSTNGLKVNGDKVDKAKLVDGDKFIVGSQTFKFATDIESETSAQEDHGGLDDDLENLDLSALDDDALGTSAGALAAENEDAEEEVRRLEAAQVDASGTGGSMGFRIVEIGIVVILLAAIGGLVFMVTNVDDDAQEGNSEGKVASKPLKEAGLLKPNFASFERGELDASGALPKWVAVEASDTDIFFGVEDTGVGGSQVLQISRAAKTAKRTSIQCKDLFTITEADRSKGLDVGVWVRSLSGDAAAFIFVEWYPSMDQNTPLRRDYRAYNVPKADQDWVELRGLFTPPMGTNAGAIGIGLTGRRGKLQFDSVSAQLTKAPAPFKAQVGDELVFEINEAARPNLYVKKQGTNVPALTGSRLHLIDGTLEFATNALPVDEWLVDTPTLKSGAQGPEWSFRIFDPMLSDVVTLEIRASKSGWTTVLSSNALTFPECTLSGTVTDTLGSKDLAVISSGQVQRFGSSFVAPPSTPYDLLIADAAHSRKFSVQRGAVEWNFPKLTLASSSRTMEISATFNPDLSTYRRLLRIARADASLKVGAISNPERMDAGIELLLKYPTDYDAISAGQKAVEAVTANYQIKQRDLDAIVSLRDDIGKNADQYIEAVDQARQLQIELENHSTDWKNRAHDVETLSKSYDLPESRRALLAGVNGLVKELMTDTLKRLEETQSQGADEAERLRSIRQEIQSQPMLAEAEDHFKNAEMEQARLKYRRLVSTYPFCRNASDARLRLLDIAEELARARASQKAQGLNGIADETKSKIEEILEFVEKSNEGLNHQAINIREPDDGKAGVWIGLQDKVKERVNALRTSMS